MSATVYDSLAFETAGALVKSNASDAATLGGITIPSPGSPWTFPAIPKTKLTVGTGAGNFNALTKYYSASATGNTDYDLTALVDPLGNAVNFANLRFFMVYNFAVTAGYNLTIDGTVTNAWLAPMSGVATAKMIVPPGWTDSGGVIQPGVLLLGGGAAAGLVTSGTSKVIRIGAGANTIVHGFAAWGVSA